MFIRKKKGVPGLNTTSTADISFMLLIFFLVTTSMDADKGLSRRLPPRAPEKQTAEIDKHLMMNIAIEADNSISIDERRVPDDSLATRVADFIVSRGPKHIIALKAAPTAVYDSYFHLQQRLAEGYREARNRVAQSRYGRRLNRCTEAQRQSILDEYPQRVAETLDEKGGTE